MTSWRFAPPRAIWGLAAIAVAIFTTPRSVLADPAYVFLNHPDYVQRLAMDILGTRPSEEDLATPPGQIPDLLDRWMTSEEFADRMVWLANDIFLTRYDYVEYFRDSYDYSDEHARNDAAIAVGEEPLRLFTHIVRNDLPLTELVAADYTIANSTLAWFWNIDYPGEAYSSQWLKGRYLDGREHAGVLSQTGFYYRYPTTFSNKQRHRANQITRIFLDDDHLLRNVSIDLRLAAADPNLNLVDATRHNPGCVACHNTLDGIGSHLFGFSMGPLGDNLFARETFYTFSKQGVQRAQMLTLREPSFYGYPTRGLKDLGNFIAHDPRFARTMAKHIYRFFLHRSIDYRDRDLLNHYGELLANSGFNTKALIKAIVASEEYRAVGVVPEAGKSAASKPAEPSPVERIDFSLQWRNLEKEAAGLDLPDVSREEIQGMARLHAIETGFSQRLEAARLGLRSDKGITGYPTTVDPLPPEELIQPFKLATPEQLHSLGRQLVGEIWNGYEGGQWKPDPFPHLHYNTDVKVAAGGYDGRQVMLRKWSVPPTYMLVLERWAEVLAEDVLERELGESVPWSQRRVFTMITGKENPIEAEPAIRHQIADWFKRFYGETVNPWGSEVDDVFGVLLYAQEQARRMFGEWYSIQVGWSHVLGMMLTDPKIAIY
jgi:hypothetical protein